MVRNEIQVIPLNKEGSTYCRGSRNGCISFAFVALAQFGSTSDTSALWDDCF